MKFPCELIAEPYIAQIRIRISKILKQKGYSQTRIATLLQVSQPVISGYLKKTQHLDYLPKEILVKANQVGVEIANILDKKGIEGISEALGVGCNNCKILRQAGPTCIYHKSQTKYLEDNCTRCLSGKQIVILQENKESVLIQLRDLFDNIINFQNINKIIPQIGLQIVYSISDPHTITDIAAFPGRIHKRKDGIPLAATPTFGASETTSYILLQIRHRHINLRCIVAMKNSPWLKNQIELKNLRSLEINKFDEDPEFAINDIPESYELPFILSDSGGVGIEPISYLCVDSILSVIEILRKLN